MTEPHRDDADWIDQTFYHCVHLTRGMRGEIYEQAVGRGITLYSALSETGCAPTGEYQGYAHTNWPCDLSARGLPKFWAFNLHRVHARISTLEHAGWMDRVAVSLDYNDRMLLQASLAELVLGGRACAHAFAGLLPIRIRISVDDPAPATLRIWPQLVGRLQRPLQ